MSVPEAFSNQPRSNLVDHTLRVVPLRRPAAFTPIFSTGWLGSAQAFTQGGLPAAAI